MLARLALTLREPTAVASEISAQRQLYESHANFVRRLVLRLGTPAADADDLVQETFVIAFRHWSKFDPRRFASSDMASAERTWLYAIAVRVAAGARRRARLRRFLGLEEIAEPRDPTTPASLFERAEARRRVRRLLEGIGEKKRTAFVLFELEGLSGEEIARVVGAPVKTVWTRLFHARREFLERLAREELRDRGGRT
jgi:RNA polymerase sigma-70 factor (ECF subfamily)